MSLNSRNQLVSCLAACVFIAVQAPPVATPPSAGSLGLTFARIQPGSFTMGCSPGDKECDSDENPPHPVRITKAFEMGKHEVTQKQWQTVMGTNPSRFKGDDLPVEQVTFLQVEEFLKKLNAVKDGSLYRLPTEAEWEYAARAGATGPHAGLLDVVAWYKDNSGGKSHPVGQKAANPWGLFDMEGNVYEWTHDWYFDYESDPVTDPPGPEAGYERVPRGGSWESTSKGARVSNRNMLEPEEGSYNVGFRCVRVATN